MLHIVLLVFFMIDTSSAAPCTKYGFKGFTYQKSQGGEDRYSDRTDGVSLAVKCFPPKITFDEIVNKLKKEASARNTQGAAVYFEFNVRGRFKRVYVVGRKPVLQLTFSTKRSNRSALVDTQTLIEQYYRKSQITFPN